MTEPVTVNLSFLARDLDLSPEQVETVVNLLDQGNPIPFIARYRKDVTGNLDEDHLRAVSARLREQRLLAERKETILRSIESLGKLTPELEKKIRTSWTSRRLEDLYLPYKPRKQTLAAQAREKGLEPLANEILGSAKMDIQARATDFIDAEKEVNSADEALVGAGYIISELYNERLELRQRIREIFERSGKIVSKKIEAKKDSESETLEKNVSHTVVTAKDEKANDEKETTDNTGDGNFVPEASGSAVLSEVAAKSETLLNDDDSSEGTNQEITTDSTVENETETSVAVETTANPNGGTSNIDPAPEKDGSPNAADEQSVVKKSAKSKKKSKKKKSSADQRREQEEKLYSDYFDFKADIRNCPAYRILAINRGEREKVLRVKLEVNEDKVRQTGIETVIPEDHPQKDFLTGCLNDAITRFLFPSLEREIRRELTENAERQGIRVFAKNLRNLLLQKPLFRRRVLAVDPGFRYGCKLVALDEFGNFLGYETVYITGSAERRNRAIGKIADLIEKDQISVIAIGNGTGCREAEDIIAKMLTDRFADREMAYIIVNEAGASVYSVSPTAKEEFPNYDALMRGAVSIGRRLQDPLNELVKIDPASLGVGIYQHDLKTKHLKESLAEVVESAVNFVGVDLNCATGAILKYVAGLNQLTAKRIFEYRMEHGPFRYREDLKKVPGFGDAAFTHSAGFLKIRDGYEPLDATWIHPESYPLAEKILDKVHFLKEDLKISEKRKELVEKLDALDAKQLSEEFSAGLMTVTDILDQLKRPGRDPRESLPAPIFKKGVMKLENLSPGMELMGTVLNVVDFGAFVDIGLHDSGLIHISRMGDRFVRDAHQRLAVGDVVKVWVVEIDKDRHRISLSMLPPGTERKSESRSSRSRRDDEGRRKLNAQSGETPQSSGVSAEASASHDSNGSERPPRRDDRRRSSSRPDNRGDSRSDSQADNRSRRDSRGDHGGENQTERRNDGRERSDSRGSDGKRSPRPGRDGGSFQRRGDRDDRRGSRFDSGRTPRVMTFESKLKKSDSLSEEMKQGKSPLRSFGDLALLLGRSDQTDSAKTKKSSSDPKGGKSDAKRVEKEKMTSSVPETEADVQNNSNE